MNTPPFLATIFYRYCLCLLLILSPALLIAEEVVDVQAETEELLNAYSLGYGDRISIKVYGEDDLTVDAVLNDLGLISFPFLGELHVLGLTVAEIQEKIAQGLEDGYLVDPKVSVTVTEYRRFYVSGEVKQPGGFVFLPGLTVRKAISLAGGFTARAATKKIFIISDEDKSVPKRVDLNTYVRPGDVVTVKQRFF